MTDKQHAFVDAYVGEARFNATAAARIAGYQQPHVKGQQLKIIPEIAAAIKAFLDQNTLSAEEVLRSITEHATGTIEDFIEVYPGGMWGFDLEKAKKSGKLHLLKELQYEKGKGAKIGLHDAQSALRDLARYHKLLTDRTEHSGSVGVDLLGEMSEEEIDARLARAKR